MEPISPPARPERNLRPTRGFTLIEIVLVMGVMAILALLVYPSYRESVMRGHRSDATASLQDLGNRLERFYAENNTYATATIAGGASTDVLASSTTPQGLYTLSVTAQTATTWTIQATRVSGGPQAGDAACGDYILTSVGARTVTGTAGTAQCW